MTTRRYRITNTGYSSERYGPCEVCSKHVSEVHYQVEEMRFSGGWTQHECKNYFGHRECLESRRRDFETTV